MTKIFTAAQAANLIWRSQFSDAKLQPREMSDGTYSLPDSVLTDRRFAVYRPILKLGTALGAQTYVDDGDFHITPPGGQLMYLSAANVGHAFGAPASGVFRFECRKDESGYSGDAANNNRRSELVSLGTRYGAGETLWEAWSTVIGSQHSGFDQPSNQGIIRQWHSVDTDVSRSPVFGIAFTGGNIYVYTRSSADTGGARHDHYVTAQPAPGTVMNWVTQAVLGQTGHLNVWLNGTQVVNVDTPIGYYLDDGGTRKLAYPHWGIYMSNLASIDVIFHANMEWGSSSLATRVATPLTVPTPATGWV